MRLAWFSPVPPVRTGIASCSADLLAALAGDYAIDTYVDEAALAGARAPTPVRSAHEFVWRHRQAPYDLTIYQLGNSSHHDYIWPYLFRFPGLTVLHDAQLHHARAAALLRTKRAADYRAEFAAAEPDASPDAAELAVAGFDSHLYYMWPLNRLVLRASRMVAVHTPRLAAELREREPEAGVEWLRLGHGVAVSAERARDARQRVGARHGIPDDAVVFGCFGGLTPDKRIPQILGAFAALLPYAPNARLLLAGAAARHYDVAADVAARGLNSSAIITGYIEDDEELTDYIAACDVTLNLRWPTAREMSGPWLRCLAAAKPTVVIDLAHVDVPSLDPRTWRPNISDLRTANNEPRTASRELRVAESELRVANRELRTANSEPRTANSELRVAESELRVANSELRTANGEPRTANREPRTANSEPRTADAVCVAIDIVDEDHSLRLAMRRLAEDAVLRAALGRAAQAWWHREHAPERMVEDYRRTIALAMARPAPRAQVPPHLVDNGDRTLETLLASFAIANPFEARP